MLHRVVGLLLRHLEPLGDLRRDLLGVGPAGLVVALCVLVRPSVGLPALQPLIKAGGVALNLVRRSRRVVVVLHEGLVFLACLILMRAFELGLDLVSCVLLLWCEVFLDVSVSATKLGGLPALGRLLVLHLILGVL